MAFQLDKVLEKLDYEMLDKGVTSKDMAEFVVDICGMHRGLVPSVAKEIEMELEDRRA